MKTSARNLPFSSCPVILSEIGLVAVVVLLISHECKNKLRLLGGLSGGLLLSLLQSTDASIQRHLVVQGDGLDGTTLQELTDGTTGETAVDPVLLDEVVDGDHLHLVRSILEEFVQERLVEDDQVDLLLTDLGLGPLLLLILALPAGLGSQHLLGLRFLNLRGLGREKRNTSGIV